MSCRRRHEPYWIALVVHWSTPVRASVSTSSRSSIQSSGPCYSLIQILPVVSPPLTLLVDTMARTHRIEDLRILRLSIRRSVGLGETSPIILWVTHVEAWDVLRTKEMPPYVFYSTWSLKSISQREKKPMGRKNKATAIERHGTRPQFYIASWNRLFQRPWGNVNQK